MSALAYYIFFIGLGIDAAGRLWPGRKVLYRVWLGAVWGTVLHIWLPALWAFAFGFTVAAHIAAAVTVFALWGGVFLWRRGRAGRATFDGAQRRDLGTLLIWAGPLFVLIAVLLYSHVLLPGRAGLYGGQSTWGDLSMHLGMITSITAQGTWPPDYSIFPGHRMCYPFLADSQAASFLLLGMPLRWAIIVPSLGLAALALGGLWLFVYDYTGKRGVATLASLLFFLNGGLGFLLMLDGAGEPGSMFREIFTAFYRTPTNNTDLNLLWTNVICDMMIPQRTMLLGFAMLPAALYLIHNGVKGDKWDMASGAVLAGGLPMMHTHTFLALGIVCAGWLLAYMKKQEDREGYLARWGLFLCIVAVLALPQLLFWTFRQSGGGGFVRVHLDWVNKTDPWLWFWVKNVGVAFILLFPALWAARMERWRWYAGALAVYVIAELIVFQPNEYDNNKLLLVWYLFTAVIVAEYMGAVWRKLQKLNGRAFLAGVMAVLLFGSALLTIGREVKSGGEFLLFGSDSLQAAAYIKEETPADAVFATWDQHVNAVSALTGRNVYVGSPSYLFFHGLDYGPRQDEVRQLYTDALAKRTLPAVLGIDYIFVSPYERNGLDVPEGWFADTYPLAYENDSIEIYAVSERAREGLGE